MYFCGCTSKINQKVFQPEHASGEEEQHWEARPICAFSPIKINMKWWWWWWILYADNHNDDDDDDAPWQSSGQENGSHDSLQDRDRSLPKLRFHFQNLDLI